ncbi:MAG: hypothetical protein ACREU7_11895, partial [Burkholderiales bacterium]
TVPRSEIAGAARRNWPVWYGIGWRSDLRGVIGLTGSFQNVVEVRLKNRVRAWGVFPCDRIAVSLEDPDAFIAAVSLSPATAATPAPKSARKMSARPKAAAKAEQPAEKPTPVKKPARKAVTERRRKSA